MPAALQSRSQVITSLLRAFRRNGYDGASLSRLSEETGLRRASLYHHFPGGKEDMARAVVTSAAQDFGDIVLAPLKAPGTPRERLESMMAALSTFYDGGKEACILALMTVGDGREVFAPEVRAGLRGWIEALVAVLCEAGQTEAVARDRAQDAVAQVQGALVLARGLNDTGVFQRLIDRLPRELLS